MVRAPGRLFRPPIGHRLDHRGASVGHASQALVELGQNRRGLPGGQLHVSHVIRVSKFSTAYVQQPQLNRNPIE